MRCHFKGTTSVIQKPRASSSGGYVLGTLSNNQGSHVPPSENIRNIWANKFNDVKSEPSTSAAPSTSSANTDRSTATATATTSTTVTEATSAWEEIDDDILIHSVKNTVIEINDESSDESSATEPAARSTRETATEIDTKPQISIKKELLDDLGEDDANIMMIDDEFDDKMNESLDLLTDTSVIDELFGRDTLMADFNNINNVVMNDPENIGHPENEIVTCPICEDRMARNELSAHLDGCNGITVKVNPGRHGSSKKPLPFYKNHAKPSTSKVKVNASDQALLRLAGYTQEEIDRLNVETEEAREYNDRIMDELAHEERQRRTTSVITQRPTNNDVETIQLDDDSNSSVPEKHPCPVCETLVLANQINDHLDECLQMNS